MKSHHRSPARVVASTMLAIVATGLAAIAIGLAGCTATAGHSPTPSRAAATGTALSLPEPTDIPNSPAVRSDVAIRACGTHGGHPTASGTATNRTSAERTYTITVFFTTDRATVIGYARTGVTVASHRSSDWTARSDMTGAGVRCVLRGVGTK